MSIPPNIRRLLEAQAVDFDVLTHPRTQSPQEAARAAYVPSSRLLCAVVLRDRRGLLVAAYPASHRLDVDALNRQLRRELAIEIDPQLFSDCEPRLIPVLAGAYGIKAIVDDSGGDDDQVFFEASHTVLIGMRKKDLLRVQRAWHGRAISISDPEPAVDPGRPSSEDIRARLHQLQSLPAMPQMAQRVMQLRANPYADIRDLANIVEQDPSLAAQVVRYAQSPFFGYRGDVASIQDAISRVLGYDLTMNIILGIALAGSFNIPRQGPLGLRAFWQHSIHCAALVQCLAKSLPQPLRPKPGLAYLAGMVHNLGVLLIGHLFPAEFYWLHRRVEERPDLPLPAIENDWLGVTHAEVGAWLMEHWNLHAEVVVATREHDHGEYDGIHAIYARLVYVANRLLKRVGIGDAEDGQLPDEMLRSLGLSEEQAVQVLTGIMEGGDGLELMVRQLAA